MVLVHNTETSHNYKYVQVLLLNAGWRLPKCGSWQSRWRWLRLQAQRMDKSESNVLGFWLFPKWFWHVLTGLMMIDEGKGHLVPAALALYKVSTGWYVFIKCNCHWMMDNNVLHLKFPSCELELFACWGWGDCDRPCGTGQMVPNLLSCKTMTNAGIQYHTNALSCVLSCLPFRHTSQYQERFEFNIMIFWKSAFLARGLF